MFAFGLVLIEFATKPDIQRLYDRELGTFRRDRLETLVELFVESLSPENTLRTLIYRMLDFDADERISFSELRAFMPDRALLMDYLVRNEGRIDTRVFADNLTENKLDPSRTHRLMAYNTMQVNPSWKKGDQDDQDVNPAIDLHDRNSSHFHTILSRKSMESGDFESKVRRKEKIPHSNWDLPEAAKRNRPLRSKYMGKYDLADAESQNKNPVYTDFLKANRSNNRIIRSKDIPPGAVVDESGNIVMPSQADPMAQRQNQRSNLNRLLEDNFIQADIRKGLESDFEKYLETRQHEEDVRHEQEERQQTIANMQPQPKFSKYFQEYLNYPTNYKPEFHQVRVDPRTGHSMKIPLDPYDAMIMDRYSDVTATYALGPVPEASTLGNLRTRAR